MNIERIKKILSRCVESGDEIQVKVKVNEGWVSCPLSSCSPKAWVEHVTSWIQLDIMPCEYEYKVIMTLDDPDRARKLAKLLSADPYIEFIEAKPVIHKSAKDGSSLDILT